MDPVKQCGQCGHSAPLGAKFCSSCGFPLQASAAAPRPVASAPVKNKWTAGLLAVFLGPFGAHALYLENQELAAAIFFVNISCLVGAAIALAGIILIFPIALLLMCLGIWLLTEFLILLQALLYWTASERRFQQRYVVEKKWF